MNSLYSSRAGSTYPGHVQAGAGPAKPDAEAEAANQRQVAEYICEMILELRTMAKASRLYKTMVPLEFAYYEAFAVAHAVEVPPEEAERLNRLGQQAMALESGDGS
jgi:hypothetical protein